jgi:succinate dehydrogenase/fumarate reductase cytochrome b subunit
MLRLYPLLLLLSFLVAAVLVIGYNAMQVAALDATAGRPVSMGRAWRFVFQGRVLGTLFLWLVAAALSLMCCLLPALYVIPLLSYVAPVMVEEGRFGFAAFSRSAELTQYNPGRRFWDYPLVKVFVLLFVGVLISYAVQLAVTVPFQIPMYVDMFRGTATGEEMLQQMSRWMWLQVPAQFLSALVSVAVYLYTCFGIALLFNDTRGRKEGTDLRSEIDAMFPGPVPPPVPPAGEPWP